MAYEIIKINPFYIHEDYSTHYDFDDVMRRYYAKRRNSKGRFIFKNFKVFSFSKKKTLETLLFEIKRFIKFHKNLNYCLEFRFDPKSYEFCYEGKTFSKHDYKEGFLSRLYEKKILTKLNKINPKIKTACELFMTEQLQNLKAVESLFSEILSLYEKTEAKFSEHTEYFKQEEEKALSEQRTLFIEKLDEVKREFREAEQRHQQEQLNTQEQIAKLQSMINKTYEQNEQLLTAQNEKSEAYKSELFELIARLNQEL